MRQLRRIALIALGLFVLGTAPASAELRQGAQSDATGDATIATGGFDSPDARLLDVTYVSVSYDSDSGTINAQFSGDLPNGEDGTTNYTITIGEPTATGCGDAASDFTLKATVGFSQSLPTPAVIYPPVTFVGTVWADPYTPKDPLNDYPGLTYHAQGTSLMHRDFRCAIAVSTNRSLRHGPGPSIDDVDPFCLRGPTVPAGDCFATAATPPPTSPAPQLVVTTPAPTPIIVNVQPAQGVAGQATTSAKQPVCVRARNLVANAKIRVAKAIRAYRAKKTQARRQALSRAKVSLATRRNLSDKRCS